MPITLITGLPGHGKGIFSLDTVNKLEQVSKRPVYYHNVKDLALKWHELKDPKDWINCPEGSIILLDEAWQTFPLRPNAQTPPDYVAQLATHRHKGFDIFIVTQQPTQLDTFVRKLVDHHYHVVRKFGAQSAFVHQFVGLNSDPQKSRKNSIKHNYPYPKKVYEWYKSAEVHTVQTKRPMRIYFLWFGVPIILALSVYFINAYLNPKTGKIASNMQTAIKGKGPNQQFSSDRQITTSNYQPEKQLNYVEAHTPVIPDFPHTAPAYAELTAPKTAPYPAACVQMGNMCKCYTQQGTKLPTSEPVCKQIVENGFFVEWQQDSQVQQNPIAEPVVYPARDVDSNFTNAQGMGSRSSLLNAPVT